jgi:hypothetical protein
MAKSYICWTESVSQAVNLKSRTHSLPLAMRSFNVLIAAALIYSTLISASNPTPTLPVADSIDGDFLPVNITAYNLEQAAAVSRQLPSTNAGRLARGLRPLPPKRRSGGGQLVSSFA